MNILDREKIERGLTQIRDRVKSDSDKENELVRIEVATMLKGQEAVNYKVAKLFAPNLSDQELVQQILRVGLKTSMELIKMIAQENEIPL